MHARHRSPGNGYRSSSSGMPFTASRISPDSSARSHAFYNPDYRSFNNRGFSRGQGRPKSFQQPPQPPPSKADILMEAGRLATQYLVSKGLLPQSALSSKWQNGNFKKQAGDYHDFRQLEELPQESRTSAHARLGTGPSDAGLGRRRYPDEVNSRIKGRRRGEYYRSNSSEWGREYGRSGTWSDRNRMSPDVDGEDDVDSVLVDEQQVGNDDANVLQKPASAGLVPASKEVAYAELGQEKGSNSVELGSKASSSSAVKNDMQWEGFKGPDHLTNLKLGNEEIKERNPENENEEQMVPEDLPTRGCISEGDLSTKNGSDLLTLCKFAKVPTKTRSALTSKVSKVDLQHNSEGDSTSNIGHPKGAKVIVQDGSHDVCTPNAIANAIQNSNYPVSGISKLVPDQADDHVVDLATAHGSGQGKCLRSQSFPDRAFMHDSELESNLGLSGSARSSSVKERGEKRAPEDGGMKEATKKPREWLPSLFTQADKQLHLSNLNENNASSQDKRASSDNQMIAIATKDSFGSSTQFPKSASETCLSYTQEKQLFPSSFKICDLNLMEASDMSDSHRSDPVLVYPSFKETEKPAAQVDVDLSISNSNTSGEYGRCMSDGKEIEVIDLENDSTIEETAFDNSQRKMETAFASTEGYPSHTHNSGEMADVQDLMISELFTNFSSCTSVPDDINRLQTEVGLHNGEGTLGDDDSIYMSLGEIPLSFIPAWEQTTPQEYEKPF